MKFYYYFSVNDDLFKAASTTFLKSNPDAEFSGLANAKRDIFTNGPFKSVSYLSEIQYKNIVLWIFIPIVLASSIN